MAAEYWLDDAAWAAIEPLLPRNQPGARRVDDRRVISGIVHVLRSGCRWKDCPAIYGPPTTIYNRWNRWSARGLWMRIFHALADVRPADVAMIDSSAVKAQRASADGKGGAAAQAIGRSRGGRTTKTHAIADGQGRPRVFLLSPGNIADITVAPDLLRMAPPCRVFLGDQGYDARALREQAARAGALVVIPNNPTRRNPHPFDASRYGARNAIERMFCRLKDYRRIATRYDRLARNFASAVALVSAITWWI